MGSVQLGLSGGEPLVRDDLEIIVAEAHSLGFYSNLITSGVGLNETRIKALKAGGLDHIQLSFQDSTSRDERFPEQHAYLRTQVESRGAHQEARLPDGAQCRAARLNIDHVEQILNMAEEIGADYVELANTQYYGWAQRNRDQLLPSREQLRRAEEVTQRFREKSGQRMRIFFRSARLLRAPAQALHEWARLDLSDYHARRHCAALSCGAHAAGNRVSERAYFQCRGWSGTNRKGSIIFAATPG